MYEVRVGGIFVMFLNNDCARGKGGHNRVIHSKQGSCTYLKKARLLVSFPLDQASYCGMYSIYITKHCSLCMTILL